MALKCFILFYLTIFTLFGVHQGAITTSDKMNVTDLCSLRKCSYGPCWCCFAGDCWKTKKLCEQQCNTNNAHPSSSDVEIPTLHSSLLRLCMCVFYLVL
nr:hypothetical protein Iba_chr11bCG16200 [Ipomoea batatas]